ncbi:MFS transporter [Aquitalea sp. USM4]|uniref:MFS transporter n=1 Tax=Aquitalea sp. USM4 TaxID=1590041 RepID=UPI00103945D0|nr:MFS transporter [Aquitalea sp. USM4]QBJ79895.1 MFS transporter [Aquitalea sp. USM4]
MRLADRPTPSSLIALLVAAAFFMENLDATVINTALPAMAATFAVQPVDLNIGITAYLLTLTLLIPASGWLADRLGCRRVFMASIVVFTLASLLCAMSQNLWQFASACVLQGVGGAMMVPVGRLAVLRNTPKQNLMQAIAMITWPGLVAPVLGPALGGFITTYASWHWIFLLNLPLGVLAFALAWWLIPPSADGMASSRFDWTGFLLCGTACLLLMSGLEQVGGTGQLMLAMLCLFCVGVLLAGLWRHCRRSHAPLLDVSILRIRTYRTTIVGGSLLRAAINTTPFLLSLMFQLGMGMDAFRSGLLLLTLFAGNLGMKVLTSRTLRRFGFRLTLLLSGLALVVLTLLIATFGPDTPWPWLVLVLLLSGMARSMTFTTLSTLAFVDVPPAQMSHANTLFNMLLRMAYGMGIAIAAVGLRMAEAWLPQASALTHYHFAFVVLAGLTLLALWDVWQLPGNAGQLLSRQPE